MKKILLLSILFFTLKNINAQHQITGNIHVGSAGFGIHSAYYLNEKSGIRLGFSAIPLSYSAVVDLGLELNMKAKASFNNLHLLYEYQPIASQKWLRLVGGVSYFVSAKGSGTLSPKDALKISKLNITLTPEDIGEINIDIDWKGFSPYLGIGLGKSIPTNKFNVSFDLGTYYLTAPRATSTGTKRFSNNEQLGIILTENMKDFRWIPVIQLNLNYKIR